MNQLLPSPAKRALINGGIVSIAHGSSSASHQGLFVIPSHQSIAPPLLPPPIPIPANGIATRPTFLQHQKRLIKASKREVDHQKHEDEDQAVAVIDGSLYSISPPPSSLPLPRFSIMRPKPASSCVMEAIESGGSVDVSATDDLRRLLRL